MSPNCLKMKNDGVEWKEKKSATAGEETMDQMGKGYSTSVEVFQIFRTKKNLINNCQYWLIWNFYIVFCSALSDIHLKTNLPTANTVKATEDPLFLCIWS